MPTIEVAATASRSAPGSSSSSPTGFGASYGDGFVGLGYQGRARYSPNNDGGVSVGFGLGNARDLVGAEIAVSSTSTLRRGFGTSGTISARLHRVVPRNVGLSVGVENATSWGGTDGGRSLFAVASRVIRVRAEEGGAFGSVTINAGVGNGRFRREADVQSHRQTFNPFASIGVRVAEPASVVADWTGQNLNLGVSLVPFRWIPLVISPNVADVFHTSGDGARFTLGAGVGFKFGGLRNIFAGERTE